MTKKLATLAGARARTILSALAFAAISHAGDAIAYNVTISHGATTNIAIASGVFKATGPDAVLNTGDLQAALALSDVIVKTGMPGGQAGDIIVAKQVTWAANTLTLDARHSIDITAHVLPAGTSSLELTTNDGGTGGALLFDGGSVSFASVLPPQSLKINTVPYTLESSVGGLAAGINANSTGNFALAYDETETHQLHSTPITETFGGNFQGLGNAITNLDIRDNSSLYVSIFGATSSSATIKNLIMKNLSVEGGSSKLTQVAGLLIENNGLISNVSISGAVKNDTAGWATGLGVFNNASGTVVACHTNVTVTEISSGDVAGLVGYNNLGTILQSSAVGDVADAASGSVGGLVALNTGTITLSYATGDVSAPGGVGGGLIAGNSGSVAQSFATGDVASSGGNGNFGGLIGGNSGSVTDTYARGSITGQNGSILGGLIGYADTQSLVQTSYSTGPSAGGTEMGGLIGHNVIDGSALNDYWNTTTSGLSAATGNGNDTGITGMTSAQLRASIPAGFSPSVWAEATGTNGGYPYLLAVAP